MITLLITGAIALMCFTYLTGWFRHLVDFISTRVVRTAAWVTSPDATRGYLPDQIPITEVHDDLLETTDGFVFVACEINKAPTHGFGAVELRNLQTKIDGLIRNLSPGIFLHKIEIVSCREGAASDTVALPEHVLGSHSDQIGMGTHVSRDDVWRTIGDARATHLQTTLLAGRVKLSRVFVLIGRKVSGGTSLTGLGRKIRGAFSARLHVERSAAAVERTYRELLLERENFIASMASTGGTAQAVSMDTLWDHTWQRLNPAETVAPPRRRRDIPVAEQLASTSIRTADDVLRFSGNKFSCTVEMFARPEASYVALLERLTDSLDFPCVITSWLFVPDPLTKSDELHSRYKTAAAELDRGHEDYADEFRDLDAVRKDCVVEVGLSILVYADTQAELHTRRSRLINLLRGCEGISAGTDDSLPLQPFIATLPGCATRAPRLEMRVGVASALLGLTGAPVGVPREDAQALFRTMSGDLIGWHFDSRLIAPNPSEIIMGAMGSGKSGYLNWKRSCLLSLGYQLITFDYNSSATRLAIAAGGRIIRLGESDHNLAIFPTRDSATPELLASLVSFLSLLAVDEERGERRLPKDLVDVISSAIDALYESGEWPNINHLLEALSTLGSDGELLRRRLSVYRSSAYAKYMTAAGEPIDLDSCPYIVFDFRGVLGDPIAAQISSMAASMTVQKLIRMDRRRKKAFDGDELDTLVRVSPALLEIFDLTARCARKDGVITTAATQSPMDFERPELSGMKTSAETRFFFKLGDPQQARKAFPNLPDGALELITNIGIGARDYRACVLWTPAWFAHLRFEHGALDQRLLLGAAVNDVVSLEAAVEGLDQVPHRLMEALIADAMTGLPSRSDRDGDPLGAPELKELRVA